MKIISALMLLSSFLISNIPSAFAKEDKALLNALHSEAEETSMKRDASIEVLAAEEPESSVLPTAGIDYDVLEKKVATQIKGLLVGISDSTVEKSEHAIESNQQLRNELENIVSSALLKGNKLDDIRTAVSAAMLKLKKQDVKSHGISSVTIESAGNALKSIVATEKPSISENLPKVQTVTVGVGENLYKIAQRVYGSGDKYLELFEANKDMLKSPDLIRAGQVLKVP